MSLHTLCVMWGTGLLPPSPGGHPGGSVRGTHHPHSLPWGSIRVPRTRVGISAALQWERPPPQPHKSWEQLGRRQGEKQLNHWVSCSLAKLFPLPFCFSFCRGTRAPPMGLSVTSRWRLLYVPSAISRALPRRKASITGCPGIVLGWQGGAARGGSEAPAG